MPLRTSTETKLLDAADELFFSQGINLTPVDAVLARAGVSAATMYRGYASKEALVAAALERRHHAWMDVWRDAAEEAATPRDALLAVFDALDRFSARPLGARWCAFLGAAAEYLDPPDEIVLAVARDTDTLRDGLRDRAAPVVGDGAASAVAEQLLLVVSGHLAMRLRRDDLDTSVARSVAVALLDAAWASGRARG
ncbi:TetR/AcrR family transcriptional regulator [Aeromicrobium sp. CFBP 8757]|uniref:TetR/AcrR family transcriptional regulator n=1 Tax=Aeromicrobium sp. CFBP 8757 TaxID=2775288 RepID=UPI00177C3343|nr:TetR/AcrR family transcriptional regulator [Aeromicrobium sp. CFBP 8757]MBD8606954.1 TetR/AcrR family transcriptional regulator [Aeromicrobium sp. CFBP 8757]